MAEIPRPRSFQQIFGEMLATLQSRTPFPDPPVDDPIRGILEASAQSDFRGAQDFFRLLSSLSLDLATASALDRLASDEGTARLVESPSSGSVTISDTSFTKLSSVVYQGQPAPIVGASVLYIEDATDWDTTGSLYIGRGTTAAEGPIAYTNLTELGGGSYWSVDLTTPTTKYHNLGEDVTVSQGGNRTIAAGTTVRTSAANALTSASFSTLFAAAIPDGETEITSVRVTCTEPGSIGNVALGSISEFSSSPFSGAAVTNPTPFSNGVDQEDDVTLRERIRALRSSRSRGTALAIETYVTGIVSLEENKRVSSAKIIRSSSQTQLVIDDGSGYETATEGVAVETVIDSAAGGERDFQLVNGRPVTRAYAESLIAAPYEVTVGSELRVAVGGVETSHFFATEEFDNPSSCSAYEIVAAINGNSELGFVARTTRGGTRFALEAIDADEDIEILAADPSYTDAALELGLPGGLQKTLWLYKNDVLLEKDGALAAIQSMDQASWNSTNITSGVVLNIAVDGTPEQSITITDQSFIDAETRYVSVAATNSLQSWADVFNYLIPGVTTTVSGGGLLLTSNLGRDDRASLVIGTSGLLGAAMFDTLESTGVTSDYSFDSNLGQGRLDVALVEEDRIAAGSAYTRGFLETPSFSTLEIDADETTVAGETGAEMWFVVDGAASIIPSGATGGLSVVVSITEAVGANGWGDRVRFAASNAFSNVAVGDWLIANDAAFNDLNKGAFRVACVESTGDWVEVEMATAAGSAETAVLTDGGMIFVRTTAAPQRVFIEDASDYTATSLVAEIEGQLVGATAEVHRTSRVRIRTNTFGSTGDIAYVAGNPTAANIGLETGDAVPSGTSHLASVLADHRYTGTPSFQIPVISTVTDTDTVVLDTSLRGFTSDSIAVALKGVPESGSLLTNNRYGNFGYSSALESISTLTLNLRSPALQSWLPLQRFYAARPYDLSPRDQLGITLDSDDIQRRYVINAYRKIKPTDNTYSVDDYYTDTDNADESLAAAFGTDFDFTDFAVHMQARQKCLGVLWRYYRHGAEGENVRVAYAYPDEASAAVELAVDTYTSAQYTDISIKLAGGAARTITNLRNTSKLGIAQTAGPVAGLYTYKIVFNLDTKAGCERQVRLNLTGGAGAVTVGNYVIATSGATGQVVAGSSTSTLILANLSGPAFVNGEALDDSGDGGTLTGNASGTQYEYGILELDITTPGVSDHGFTTGDSIWLKNTGSFTTGQYSVIDVDSDTIAFYGATGLAASTIAASGGSVGTVSADLAGEVSLAGSDVVNGDLLNLSSATSLILDGMVLKTLAKTDSYVTVAHTSNVGTTAVSWGAINSTDNVNAYALGTNTSTTLSVAVNALTDAPLSGFDYAPATAIANASYEAAALGGSVLYYYLKDGINWVKSHNTPATVNDDFQFTFKEAIDGDLTGSIDWENEDIRLVPTTAKNVADFLSSQATSGLFSGAEVVLADRGLGIQVTTDVFGSDGSVNITGGGADVLRASVRGSATTASTSAVFSLDAASADGLIGQSWVRLRNSLPRTKTIITASTTLVSWNPTTGLVTLGGTTAWNYSGGAGQPSTNIDDQAWQIEKHGDFVCFAANSGTPISALVAEGDWVIVEAATTPANDYSNISTLNRGTFRVVRATTSAFWIENSSAVAENVYGQVTFLDYHSIMPGDSIVVNTSAWSADNLGTWTITARGAAQSGFYVDVTDRTPTNTSSGASAAIAALIQVYEAEPSELIKKVISICPNQNNSSWADVKVDTSAHYAGVGSAYGTTLLALDKLYLGADSNTGAATTTTTGLDAYKHSTGLIEEANRVVYGDDRDGSYPGIAAAGVSINISGPRVRRASLSLSLRVKTGAAIADIKDKVKSAVATAVNKTRVGESLALSEVLSAAQSVNGVIAASIVSPTYNATSDRLTVQPSEKLMIINVDQDVLISFVGT